MDLIVLESPNKVKDVQRYAEAAGFQVRVTATVGHLLDLPPMSAGPAIDIRDFAPETLQPKDSGAADRVAHIQAAIAQADRVIVATDPDREGEAIASEVWPWIPAGKAWRATFEEITPAGVEKGLRAMRPELNTPAVEAALTRRVMDRLAGWHGTDLVFKKLRNHRGISAGRLQSAALRLVVERYRDNQGFRSTSTFGVRIKLRTGSGAEVFARLVDATGGLMTFPTRPDAEAFHAPKAVAVAHVESTKKNQKPRPPFEAASWLQVACKALRITVKDATKATQTLFERGLTTYPRTDTVRVADEAVIWARTEIERRFGAAYLPPSPWNHKDRGSNAVQGAHEAIRPTIPHDSPDGLTGREEGEWGTAYAIIETRFLASQAAARVVEETVARLEANSGASFLAKGQVEIFDGWRRVLSTDAEEDPDHEAKSSGTPMATEDDETDRLPPLAVGDEIELIGVEITTHTTRPKPLLTQASLVGELKRLGIGRPSTYHTVVPLLLGRGWATEQAASTTEKRKKKSEQLPVLVPAQVGLDLSDFLGRAFPGLVDYDFTASMEAALDQVEAGERARADVAGRWWLRFEQELAVAKTLQPRLPERKDLGPCPKCAAEGRDGRLRLIEGVSIDSKKPYAFAACDADSKDVRVCGEKAQVQNGELMPRTPCPHCGKALKAINRKDGGHSWRCEEHGWFLADRAWRFVQSPSCSTCNNPMAHRERREPKGEFYWACFADKVFLDSNRFGALEKAKRRRGKM